MQRNSWIIREWKTMKLITEMLEAPKDSEVAVFRSFVERLMGFQKKIDSSYHGDHYLSDRLINTVEIPRIQEEIHENDSLIAARGQSD